MERARDGRRQHRPVVDVEPPHVADGGGGVEELAGRVVEAADGGALAVPGAGGGVQGGAVEDEVGPGVGAEGGVLLVQDGDDGGVAVHH